MRYYKKAIIYSNDNILKKTNIPRINFVIVSISIANLFNI